jgi:2-polyprenyl-3-methyl-5-hydroxy-6-metoxy-1,4-benzoquinol methylase
LSNSPIGLRNDSYQTWSKTNKTGKIFMTDKRHNYEYEVDSMSDTAPANVVRMVGQNKRVVELGCGPGSITKLLATQGQNKVTGLELDSEAIEIAKSFCDRIFQADLNSKEWPRLLDDYERFEVAVAADVLEHLYDPWTALQRMVSLIKPDGYLVISLPHVGHAAVLGCIMNGNFEYRDWGLLDRTHIRFFCLKNIENMFAQANLKIIEAKYVTKLPEETEFAASWAGLSSEVQDTLMSGEHSEIYQVVVKAVPVSSLGDAVPLTPPSKKYIRSHIPKVNVTSWKTRVGQYLSPQSRMIIRKLLAYVGIRL